VKVQDLDDIRQLLEPHLGSPDIHVQKAVDYLQRWIDWGPMGMSTTCVYQFVGHQIKRDEVISYFLLDGLGIAMRMNSHLCHMFFGHLFSHRTALPIIVRDGKTHSKDPHFQVFEWGGDS
jgi:hypothetical protein